MSISRALLFYSTKSTKSMQMKRIINEVDNFESICVDSVEIRKLLLNDTKYKIRRIPCILLLYDNNEYKILTRERLDMWFKELLYNVKQYRQSQKTIIDDNQIEYIPTTPYQPETKTTSSAIKKEEPTPAELAKKMMEERDSYDEQIAEKKPF